MRNNTHATRIPGDKDSDPGRVAKDKNTELRSLFKTTTILALCLIIAVPGFPQNYGDIGPSNGEVVGIIAGVAVVVTVAGYLIYRGTHKHASIQGCVSSDQNGLSLKNESG